MEIKVLLLIFLFFKFTVSQDLMIEQLQMNEYLTMTSSKISNILSDYLRVASSEISNIFSISEDEARNIFHEFLEPYKLKATVHSVLPYNLFKVCYGDLMRDDEVSILLQDDKKYSMKLVRELFKFVLNGVLGENYEENSGKKLQEPMSIRDRKILMSLENEATIIVPQLFRSNFSIMSPIINTFFPDLKNITLVKIRKEIIDYNVCERVMKKAEMKFDLGQNNLNNLDNIRLDENNQLNFVNFKFIVDHIKNKTELLLLKRTSKTSTKILPLSYWMAVDEALNTDMKKFVENFENKEYEKLPWVSLKIFYNHSSMVPDINDNSVNSTESNVNIKHSVNDNIARSAGNSLDSNDLLLNSDLKIENLDKIRSYNTNSNIEDQEIRSSPPLIESTSVKSDDLFFTPVSPKVSDNLSNLTENSSSLGTPQSSQNGTESELEPVLVETEIPTTSSFNDEQQSIANETDSTTTERESSTLQFNDEDNDFQNPLPVRETNILSSLENSTIIVPYLFKNNFSVVEVNNSSIVSIVESKLNAENETISDKLIYPSTNNDSLVNETWSNSQDSNITLNSQAIENSDNENHPITTGKPIFSVINSITEDKKVESSPPGARESRPLESDDLFDDEHSVSSGLSLSDISENDSFEITQSSTNKPTSKLEPINAEIEIPETQTESSKDGLSSVSETEPSSPPTQVNYDKSRIYSDFASCLIYYLANKGAKNSTFPTFNQEQILKSVENPSFIASPPDTESSDISSYQDPYISEFHDDSHLFERSNRELHQIPSPSGTYLDYYQPIPYLSKQIVSEDDLLEMRKFIDQKIKDSKKRKHKERLIQLLENEPKSNVFRTKTSNRLLKNTERNSASESETNEKIDPVSEIREDNLNQADTL